MKLRHYKISVYFCILFAKYCTQFQPLTTSRFVCFGSVRFNIFAVNLENKTLNCVKCLNDKMSYYFNETVVRIMQSNSASVRANQFEFSVVGDSVEQQDVVFGVHGQILVIGALQRDVRAVEVRHAPHSLLVVAVVEQLDSIAARRHTDRLALERFEH